ncbi:uncharacterized protein LOC143929848 isoform X2 [Lithobates pipiens]
MTNWRHVDINNLVSIGSLDHFKLTAEHFKHDGIPSLVLQHLWMLLSTTFATILGVFVCKQGRGELQSSQRPHFIT